MGLLTLYIIALEVFAAIYASRHKWVARVMLWCMAAFMLAYQIYYYVTYPTSMPIAFSTFTYFLFGIAVFLPVRPFKTVAAFCSVVAGGMYLSAFIFFPDTIYARQPEEATRMIGYLLHHVLLCGALLLYSQYRVKKIDIAFILAFVAFIVVYVEVAVHVFQNVNTNNTTVGIIEATVIQLIAPEFVIKWWWYVLWYPFVGAVIWGLWELTSFINRRLLRHTNVKASENTKGDEQIV